MPLCPELSTPFRVDAIISIININNDRDGTGCALVTVFGNQHLLGSLLGLPGSCRVLSPRLEWLRSWPLSLSVRWSVYGRSPLQPVLLAHTGSCSESREAGRLRAGFPSGQGWGGGAQAGGRAEGGGGVAEGKTSHCNPMTLPTWGWGRWPRRALGVLAARPAGNNSLRIIRVFTRHENSCFPPSRPPPAPTSPLLLPPPHHLHLSQSETLSQKILARGTESFA